MPFYDYKCKKCGKITTIHKKSVFHNESFWEKRRIYRCKNCGSRKLEKVFSSFTVFKKESTADMLNDLSKKAPINFVPDYRPVGPPPGGCPYAQQEESNNSQTSSK